MSIEEIDKNTAQIMKDLGFEIIELSGKYFAHSDDLIAYKISEI